MRGTLDQIIREDARGAQEGGKTAIAVAQMIEGALLGNPPVIKENYQIGIANRRETMGNDERGAVGAQPVDRSLDPRFGFDVQRGRRLVEHQNGGILENGAGERDSLPFAARKTVTRSPTTVS